MESGFWKDCPAVETVPGRLGGRPVVKDSRVAADTILEAEELGETAEETAYNYGLKLQDVIDTRVYAHNRNGRSRLEAYSFRSERSRLAVS